jgi:DNA polymerase-3 subunit delta'
MGIDQTMSDFDQMEYQSRAFSELTHIIRTKKVPNALLFHGNENTGKKEAAYYFARGCNCSGQMSSSGDTLETGVACNNCKSCRKIDGESHPDIHCIDLPEEKKAISIAQIRALGTAISTRPNEAEYRMVLILNADKMNPQAQNALLKMLEEPPERTFFILIAQKMSLLLATIISRCRKIRFKPLTENIIEQYLINNFNVDSQQAYIASRTSGSDLKKALAYSNLGDNTEKKVNWINQRKYLLDGLAGIIIGSKSPLPTPETNDRGNSRPNNRPNDRAGQMPDRILRGLTISRRLSLDPALIDDSIAIMKTFFRDLIIFKFHPKKIVNLDFFDVFSDINQRIAPDKFNDWLNTLYKMEKRLLQNSSTRLTLDQFFLKIGSDNCM